MSELLTAQQFAARRPDLPDDGRWAELVEGRVVSYDPPDSKQGTVVLNLSKALSDYLQTTQVAGYACFDLGLIVGQDPDTVRFPALSFFASGSRFGHSDVVVTPDVPDLVVEVPCDPRRRANTSRRVDEYMAAGARLVWVVDPFTLDVLQVRHEGSAHVRGEDRLTGDPVLLGFELNVSRLFAEPDWWR